MGLLDRFFKKDSRNLTLFEDKLKTAFSLVNVDIKHLQKELKHLHAGHELTQQDIKNLSLWLGYLKKNTEDAEENFKTVSSWLHYLNEQNEKTKKILENQDFELKKLKQHVATPVATLATGVATPFSTEKTPKSNAQATGVANVGYIPNVAFATDATPKTLTNPLKQLLNFMIAANDPISYDVISQKMGKSKVTIRVNMNRLKRRGLVEEFTTPQGSKLFAVKNAEKVKKLYNVQSV